ncbi:MAG TPA: DnaJ domain-containing protein [Candidatus Saccharimonadales bacterium]|nr:DnaJ domain-containing protein [Candidatus Saccharimonadales bacterium]
MPDDASLDFFKLLGVGRDASDQEIKKAHKRLVRKYHSDTGGATANDEKFMKIQAAYETLKDPYKRAEHEAELGKQEQAKMRRREQARRRRARAPTEDATNIFGEHIRDSHSNTGPGVSSRPPHAASPPPRASPAPPPPGSTNRPKPSPTPAPSYPPPMRWYEYFLADSVSGKLLALFASAGLTTAVILIPHAVATGIEAGASQDHNFLAALVLLAAGLAGGIGGIFGILLTAYCFFSLIAVTLREIGSALRQTP